MDGYRKWSRVKFHKACKHKNLLSTNKNCFAKIGDQPEHPTVTNAVTSTMVISCLAKTFAKQNVLLYEIGPRTGDSITENNEGVNHDNKRENTQVRVHTFNPRNLLAWNNVHEQRELASNSPTDLLQNYLLVYKVVYNLALVCLQDPLSLPSSS